MTPRARRSLIAFVVGIFLVPALLMGVGSATADPAQDTDRHLASSRAAAARAAYATIEGTGSTWSELIVQKWIADVDANGMEVVYTGGGSTKGRKDFANSTVDFAISEIPYQGVDERGQADKSDRPYAYLPIVAGGTAFTYQLKIGNEQVRNLRLSGETLAKIFTGGITSWSDPAITEDNNGREFPDIPVTPVVRADGSGTTAQFTAWMDSQYPTVWRDYFGKSGLTSYFPTSGRMRAKSGSDQVMNEIKSFSGNGYIGYVEYAYPVNADYPVVKVLNKAGYFVEPNQYNTAVALTKARIDPKDLTQILDGVYNHNDPRAYPLSSYSYMIIPTSSSDSRMTTAKRQTLADFLYHSLCAGQASAGPYGYSPLTLNLVEAGFKQVAKLKAADSAVDLADRDVRSCNNPTFDGKNPNRNVLAEIAPQPAACDKVGEGPCVEGTGENVQDPGGNNGGDGDNDGDDTGGPGGTDDTGPGAGPGGVDDTGTGPGTIDPETGEVIGTDGTTTDGSGAAVYANSTLVADRPGDSRAFGWLAVAELLALVLVPGLLVAFFRSRRAAKGTR